MTAEPRPTIAVYLGLTSAVAAVLDLVLQRFGLRAAGASLSHDTLIELARWAALPRNVAALAGLVALGAVLLDLIRDPGLARLGQRLGLAAFAGIFMPTITLAAVLPAERTTPQVVLFATAAASVLALLVSISALRLSAPRGLRLALLCAALSAFAALVVLVSNVVSQIASSALALEVTLAVRRVGELAWLAVAFAVAPSVLVPIATLRERASLAAGIAATIAAALGLVAAMLAVRGEFSVLLYGAQRLELFLEDAPAMYLGPLALALGIGVAAVLRREVARIEAGAGVLLLFAAGYAPRAPGRLLMMVLGTALLARASIAIGSALVGLRAPEPSSAPPPADGADALDRGDAALER